MVEHSANRLKRPLVLVGLALSLMLLGVFLVTLPPDPKTAGSELAEQWLEAVAKGEVKLALETARQLVPGGWDKIVNDAYVKLAQSEHISDLFLKDSFNYWDFKLWQDALFFQRQARALGKSRQDEIQALATAVRQRFEPVEKPKERPHASWPRQVWDRQWGGWDRQIWVLCELAYQLGYETQIVCLEEAGRKIPLHVIAEIRRRNQVWVVDPVKPTVLAGSSVEALAADTRLLQKLWPDQPNWRRAVQRSMFYTHSYPQSFCWRNQLLYYKLKPYLADRCPRFGDDPVQRQQRYCRLRKKNLGRRMRFNMMVWNYPFRLLRENITINEKQAQPAAGGNPESN